MTCPRRLINCAIGLTLLGVSMSVVLSADQSNQPATGNLAGAQVKVDDAIDIDSPGVQLARRHLAELLPLLSHLRAHEPAQYDKAIRELDRAAKRLESQRRRGGEFYDLALLQWQSRGRIDLLKAKLRVRPSESDRKRLLAEMRSLREVEIQRLRLEWEVLSERQRMLAAYAKGKRTFDGVDLSGATLTRADLSEADLSRAILSEANLSPADLSGANLSGANLSGAILRGADLRGADLRGAILDGAILDGARR